MNRLVLVVDDDEALRDSVSESLRDEGFGTVCATNGREALDYLRAAATPPCLIFLDLMMPIMNGWQFRDEQKRDAALAAIPVVIITANGSFERDSIDATEVLEKPVRLDKLLDTAQRLCPC